MTPPAAERQGPGLLYALRLAPAAARQGLQGEVEHVVTGERCRFQDAAELVAWLEGRQDAAAGAGLAPG